MAYRRTLRTIAASGAIIAFCLGSVGTNLIHNIVHGSRCSLTAAESAPPRPWDGTAGFDASKPIRLPHACMVCTMLSHMQLFSRHAMRAVTAPDQSLGPVALATVGMPLSSTPRPIAPRAPPSHV